MTKADVQYLKHRTITNTFVLNQNKQIPKDPNLPEYQKDAMDEFFEDIKIPFIIYWLQYFLKQSNQKEQHLFYTKGRGCNAKGFTVLQVLQF